MKTKHHTMGEEGTAYLIAEIGLNHNGEEDLALRMIEAAARSGAHCVKFQLYRSALFFDRSAGLGEGPPGSLLEFFRQFELPEESWQKLARAAEENGVDFLCSVFDEESLHFYKELLQASGHSTHYLKIASTDLTNRILLEQAKRMEFEILLSTGASTEEEVERTIGWTGRPALLFQCVSSYPARPSDYNLRLLPVWKKKYGCAVGVSDHCETLTVSLAAAALGVIDAADDSGIGGIAIERHFTLDRNLPGPDHALSSTPVQMRELREAIDLLQAARGTGIKESVAAEEGARRYGRRSLYYRKTLPAGHVLSADDIIALRPGTGIPVERYTDYTGRSLRTAVQEGSALKEDDFT
jgi:sialic acid synthase SpsE